MDLIVAATAMEVQPLVGLGYCDSPPTCLVTGPGLVESTLNLTRFLASPSCPDITRVLNVGVAGAYYQNDVKLLDICLAEQEILADFGIVFEDRIDSFSFPDLPNLVLDTDAKLIDSSYQRLRQQGFAVKKGKFLTVNSASGTLKRGAYLAKRYQAICENMEGFAIVRVCQSFAIPVLELRCISNLVEDRNVENWQMAAACDKLGEAVAAILK